MGQGCSSDVGCLTWLRTRRRRAQSLGQFCDASPQTKEYGRVRDTNDIEKALASAHALPANWATPVPAHSPGSWTAGTLEFEISLDAEEVASSSKWHRRRGRMLDAGLVDGNLQPPQMASPGKSSFGLEQLFASPGSLPAGLPKVDRDGFSRQTTPTAASEQLQSVPHELLIAKSPDGQRLRLKLLSGTTIVWFTAGYEGKRFVYERAAALGINSIIIDSPESWSRQLVDEGIISRFIGIDMSLSSDQLYYKTLEEIKKIGSSGLADIDAIATVVELSVAAAARLAEALGLPGPLPAAVDRARDKRCTRASLRDAGLPTPAFDQITCKEDLSQAAKVVGFPAVLKPVSGAASLGVKKVSSEAELLTAYVEVVTELRSLVVCSGALVKDDGQTGNVQADSVIGTTFLLEQYLDGPEVDVDVVMSEGEWRYAAVSDNGPTLEPYFNETWAVSPSLLPRAQQQELRELAVNCVKALGFRDGVFHVECKYTSKGPHLIEVNARMGGGPVHATNLRTWGVDLVDETILAAVGIPSRPYVPRQPLECIANSDVNTLKTGMLKNLNFLQPLKDREGVVSFSPHVRTGDRVTGPADGLPTWLVEIVVSRSTPEEALKFMMDLEAEIQAKVELL